MVFYLWNAGVTASHDQQFNTTFAWDVDLLAGYAYEFVPNTAVRPGTDRFGGLKNPTLHRQLNAWRPEAILLFGYNYHTHVHLVFWSRFKRIPLLFRGDSHLLGRTKLSLAKKLSLHLLFRQFKAFLCTGVANRAYFQNLGIPESKLFMAPHSVNAAHFVPTSDLCAQAKDLRQSLGVDPETRVILFAGKFVPAKQPAELLQAFLDLKPDRTALVFVGDGEEKTRLQRMAASAPSGTVHFLPFANQSEMPARYLMADIFVLPSRGLYETWGLAVNEAMHMGVPCIVSDRVGCQQDLVTEGETGWTFAVNDPIGLHNALERGLAADRAALKPHIARRIGQYTYKQTTEGLLAALAATRLGSHSNP